jgi:FkbM family methyltransferase
MKQLVTAVLRNSLPPGAKRSLVNLAFNLDKGQFQRLATDHLFAPDMRLGLDSLARRGFSPRRILDIGAFEGEWSNMARAIWPAADLVMIEANPDKVALLRDNPRLKNATVIESLLGPTDGADVEFHLMESGSSVFEEHSGVPRRLITLTQRTLDSMTRDLGGVDLIKIDVQGYELEVLKGGPQTLASAQAILIELSLIEINEGAPLLDQALSFMRAAGFVAYDILELHRRPLDGAMNQIDVLFVGENSVLRGDKRHWA